MVWVITGNLNSSNDDAPDATPLESSHYIRPCRSYRLGRMGGWSEAPGKPKTKPRPHDFRIKSLAISKDGAWSLQAAGEDWEPLDDPTSATNLDPYALTLTLHTNATRQRSGEGDQPLTAGVYDIQSGDTFFMESKIKSAFTLEWIPYFFCHSKGGKLKEAAKTELLSNAKALGVSMSFSSPLPHHTHYLVDKVTPSAPFLQATMSLLHPVLPTFFDTFHELAKPPAYPDPFPLPEPPEPPTEEQLAAAPKAYEREMNAWERSLLALNPDVGSDWRRWWGHGAMEVSWGRRPREEMFLPGKEAGLSQFEPRGWARDGRRRGMFQGVVVVSYRNLQSSDEEQAQLLTSGGGYYFSSTLLTAPDITLGALLAEIEEFKKAKGIDKQQSKLVLVIPNTMSVEPSQQEEEHNVKTLREMARALTNGKLIEYTGGDLIQAIYDIDPTPLLAPALPPPPEPTPSNNTAPFPSSGIPGTHPEDSLPSRSTRSHDKGKGRAMNQGGSEAGPSGVTTGRVEGEEEMPAAQQQQGREVSESVSPPKKLTKFSRAKSKARQASLFGSDDDEDTSTTAHSRAPRTQDGHHQPSLGTTMEVDEDESSQPAPAPAIPVRAPPTNRRPHTLKRAAHSQPSANLFDSSSDEEGEGKRRTDRRDSKKSREERLQEIAEEDERLAKEEAEKARERREKGLEVLEEEEVAVGGGAKKAAAGAAKGRKRGASEAVSEGEGQAPKGKGKAAPVAPARKRLRSASVQPEEEEAVPVPATTSSKKKAPAATATGKGGKKESASALKKAAELEKAEAEAHLLIVKPKRSTKKDAASEAAFAEDFNRLKIVRPTLTAMKKPQKHRMGWNEIDPDEEMNRLIREEQEMLDDPDKWAGKATQMFVVHSTQLARRDHREPRRDLQLEEKWAGRPNFKRFKPKNPQDPHHAQPQHIRRPSPELVIPKPVNVDFGIGEGYRDKTKVAYRTPDDDQDDSDLDAGDSPKLNFKKLGAKAKKAPAASKSKAATKSKGGKKKVVSDSEDDSNDDVSVLGGGSSNTLRAGGEDEEMLDLDSDEEAQPRSKATKAKASTSKGKKAAAPTPTPKRAAAVARKPPPTMLVLDSDEDDDDDDGRTFKGFGTKRKR